MPIPSLDRVPEGSTVGTDLNRDSLNEKMQRNGGHAKGPLRSRSSRLLRLWWIPEGTIPTLEDAIAGLRHLRATPDAIAFTISP